MFTLSTSLLAVLAVSTTVAFELPFQLPFMAPKVVNETALSPSTVRIAIIGAGAGGTSAAYWISLAKERFQLDVEVDIYEKEHYIGGRSTVVYPFNDTKLTPIELGASIFIQENKNLMRASTEFNLTRNQDKPEGEQLSVWDGQSQIVTLGGGRIMAPINMLKLIWRYGFDTPPKVGYFVQLTVKQFGLLYTVGSPKWENLESLAVSMDWVELLTNTMSDFVVKLKGLSEKYAYELIEGATRVNYGQNVDKIHALEGMCSLAANGATSIKGGNRIIFEKMAERSGANVHLSTAITSVSKKDTVWTVQAGTKSTDYNAVIVAAPFHQTGIVFPAAITGSVPPQPYVHLHVTLIATTAPHPNAVYFGGKPGGTMPPTILTTYDGARHGGKEPEFNSLSYHGAISGKSGSEVWSVKIFSEKALTDEWLDDMFLGQVKWVYRKEWDAYPQLPPTTSFPPVVLDKGLYYVNAFEPFISTMETETIASRNVVDLLLNKQFGTGICPAPTTDAFVEAEKTDFVLGWDC